MVNTRIMVLVAILAVVGAALPVVSIEVSAQDSMTGGNMTEGGNMTGNMTEGGNMTDAGTGNISGVTIPG